MYYDNKDYEFYKDFNKEEVYKFLKDYKISTWLQLRNYITAYCVINRMKIPNFTTVGGKELKKELINLFNVKC